MTTVFENTDISKVIADNLKNSDLVKFLKTNSTSMSLKRDYKDIKFRSDLNRFSGKIQKRWKKYSFKNEFIKRTINMVDYNDDIDGINDYLDYIRGEGSVLDIQYRYRSGSIGLILQNWFDLYQDMGFPSNSYFDIIHRVDNMMGVFFKR